MQIISIAIDALLAHPENPNRMSKSNFSKLVRNIESTKRYEPLIVRPHPKKKNCYQIINGHHRKLALEQAGTSSADCVVWDVDDDQARILLTSLNRLSGSDDLSLKSDIFKKLGKNFSAVQLAKILPQTKQQIEKLTNLKKVIPPKTAQPKCFLGPLIFFLTDDQKEAIDRILPLAKKDLTEKTNAQRNSAALIKMAEAFEAQL